MKLRLQETKHIYSAPLASACRDTSPIRTALPTTGYTYAVWVLTRATPACTEWHVDHPFLLLFFFLLFFILVLTCSFLVHLHTSIITSIETPRAPESQSLSAIPVVFTASLNIMEAQPGQDDDAAQDAVEQIPVALAADDSNYDDDQFEIESDVVASGNSMPLEVVASTPRVSSGPVLATLPLKPKPAGARPSPYSTETSRSRPRSAVPAVAVASASAAAGGNTTGAASGAMLLPTPPPPKGNGGANSAIGRVPINPVMAKRFQQAAKAYKAGNLGKPAGVDRPVSARESSLATTSAPPQP
jgi:hypothetical protein